VVLLVVTLLPNGLLDLKWPRLSRPALKPEASQA